MPIVVRCSDCGALLKFRDDALGKKAKCTKCKSVVQVRPNGESRHGGEGEKNDDSDFLNNLSDAVATAASQSKRHFVKPNPQPESVPTTGPTHVKAPADARTLLGARPRVRIVVLILMLVPVVFASHFSLLERLAACFVPLMLTGTFRTSRIRGDRFTTRIHVAFLPVVSQRCNLRGVTFVDAKYGRIGSGVGTFLLFGPMQVIFGRVFDFLMPSIGGPYQIHLVTANGRELVAWQGFAEQQFRSMLDLLVGITKAELRSM
jgi:hypothetical protein